jgi:hypothetical protein
MKGPCLLSIMSLLICSACNFGGERKSLTPNEIIETPHFKFTLVNRCLKIEERKKLLREAHESKVKILELIAPYIRPGDFRPSRSAKAPASPPEPELRTNMDSLPQVRQIPVKVMDRSGRSFTDGRGIEVARHYLPRHDMTHELVHYLAGASWAPVDEGLACYITETLKGPDKQAPLHLRVLVYLELNMLRPINPKRLEKGMSRVDYDAAGSFVKFLVEKYGWHRFFQLYQGPKRNYLWIYSKSEHELIYEWRKALDALNLRRSGDFYKFRARLTTGMKGAR